MAVITMHSSSATCLMGAAPPLQLSHYRTGRQRANGCEGAGCREQLTADAKQLAAAATNGFCPRDSSSSRGGHSAKAL